MERILTNKKKIVVNAEALGIRPPSPDKVIVPISITEELKISAKKLSEVIGKVGNITPTEENAKMNEKKNLFVWNLAAKIG